MGNKLPKGWTSCPLKDVVASRKGKKPATVIDYKKKGYDPYILIDELEGKPVRAFTNDPKVPRASKEDILLVWDGSIGKCASGMSGAVGSTIAVLSPKNGLNTRFLEYFIRRSKNHILETSTGTGLQHINKNFLKTVEIPLPPDEKEQKRIADNLDILLAKVKDAQSRLDKIPQILKRFRQSILAAAFSRSLTEDWREGKNLPEWAEVLSGNLFSFVTSGSRGWAKYYSEAGRLFLRIGNLNHFTIALDLTKKQFVNPPEGAEGTRTRVQKNDILISITADVGMIGFIPDDFEEAYINQHISLARPNANVLARYLAWYLVSPEGQDQFKEMQRGATKVGLGLDDIKNITIPLPTLEEQYEIVSRIEKLFALADSIETKYKIPTEHIEKLEQSILAKAFRGELV